MLDGGGEDLQIAGHDWGGSLHACAGSALVGLSISTTGDVHACVEENDGLF